MGAFQKYLEYLDGRIEDLKNRKGYVPDIEILRLIYIDLGQKMSFDPHYTFGNSRQKQAIYDRFTCEEQFDEVLEKKEAICKSLAYMLDMILPRYGIKSKVTFEVNGRGEKKKRAHVYNTIELSDKKRFIIDLVEDFEFIQTGSKTKSFAVDIFDEETCLYSEDEIREIDQEIGYIPEGLYMDDILWMMERAVSNEKVSDDELFEFIIDNFDKYVDIRNMGYVVRTHYYDRMIEHFFSKDRVDNRGRPSIIKIEKYDCYREIDGERHYSLCLITCFRGEKIYLFNNEKNCFERISPEHFSYLAQNGLEVPNKGRANKLKRHSVKSCIEGQSL